MVAERVLDALSQTRVDETPENSRCRRGMRAANRELCLTPHQPRSARAPGSVRNLPPHSQILPLLGGTLLVGVITPSLRTRESAEMATSRGRRHLPVTVNSPIRVNVCGVGPLGRGRRRVAIHGAGGPKSHRRSPHPQKHERPAPLASAVRGSGSIAMTQRGGRVLRFPSQNHLVQTTIAPQSGVRRSRTTNCGGTVS